MSLQPFPSAPRAPISWPALREATASLRDEDLSIRFAATLRRCASEQVGFDWEVFLLCTQHMLAGSEADCLALEYATRLLPERDPRWFDIATRARCQSRLAAYAYDMVPPGKRKDVEIIRAKE